MSSSAHVSVLFDAGTIAARVDALASEIRRDLPDVDLHLVCVLKGAFIFLSDLARALGGSLTVDFLALASYGTSTRSSGEVRLVTDLAQGIEGRHVLVVEDIVDTGATLEYLQTILAARAPRSLRTACLIDKPSCRTTDVRVDYVGFTIDDTFVVGYGLDHAEHYRNLPYIGVVS